MLAPVVRRHRPPAYSSGRCKKCNRLNVLCCPLSETTPIVFRRLYTAEDLGDGFGPLTARSSPRLDAPIADGVRVRILIDEAQTLAELARQVAATCYPYSLLLSGSASWRDATASPPHCC